MLQKFLPYKRHIILLLSLVCLFTVSGCSSDCFDKCGWSSSPECKACIGSMSNSEFLMVWVGWGILLFIGWFAAAIWAGILSGAEFAIFVGLFYPCLILGLLSFLPYPGFTLPSTIRADTKRQAVQPVVTEKPLKVKASRSKRQVVQLRYSIKNLKEYSENKLEPLVKSYTQQYQEYFAQVKIKIHKAGITNHETLLRKSGNQEIKNLLQRCAILKSSLDWLQNKIANSQQTIAEMDQAAWKLERMIELKEVSPANEREQIEKLIQTAEIIVKEGTSPSQKQDLGNMEKQIFEELAR